MSICQLLNLQMQQRKKAFFREDTFVNISITTTNLNSINIHSNRS